MIQIRYANEKDVSVIRLLAISIWWPTYRVILSREQIQYMLDNLYDEQVLKEQMLTKQQAYILYENNNESIGFASFGVKSSFENCYKLHKLYCLPNQQGKGIGKQLLEFVIEEVKKKQATFLDLNVNKYNPAKSFYEKYGFEIIEEIDIPIGPYWMNDFIMRKQLKS